MLRPVPENPLGKLALLHLQSFKQLPETDFPRLVLVDLCGERATNMRYKRGRVS